MADKKPGLLKRIFSFGFGKKKQEEVEDEVAAIEAPREEDNSAALKAEAEAKETAKAQAAQEKADAAAAEKVEKERIAAEKAEAAAIAKAEKEKLAAEQAEAKRLEKELAKKQAEAEKARLKQEAAEELAAKKADAAKSAKEKAANEKARKEQKEKEEAERKREQDAAKKEEAERLAAQEAADEAARIEAEQLAADEAAKAEEEELRLAELAKAEEQAAQEALEEADHEDDFEDATDDEPVVEVPKTSGEMAVTLTERKAKPVVEEEPEQEEETERKAGWLKRLTKGLSRSSTALTENITKVFTDKKLDDDTLQELEDILIQADLGVETAMKITDALSAQKFGKTVTDQEVREIMAEEIEKILAPVAVDLDLDLEHQPHVILMIGVNGSGKTTTIGKLSQKLYDAGFSTSLIAGDTFRAAAIEQLKIWGERTQSPVLSRPLGADSAGLAYDAWEMTRDERRDVMLMDTAGRLQNRTELMEELAKIVRVLKKQDPSAPHTVLLTLDATTGQNALNQVEIFQQVAGVNGLVMTKLDGTARGGIMVAIAAKYKLPVYFVGVGEQVEDLEPFEARDFARSIAGLPREE